MIYFKQYEYNFDSSFVGKVRNLQEISHFRKFSAEDPKNSFFLLFDVYSINKPLNIWGR